jgi:predicted phosphate transport protein (TIGR00153 family)
LFRKWIPNRDIFFDLFEKHAAISFEAAQLLAGFSTSSLKPLELSQKIKILEHAADKVTQYCVETLHKTFITPMDRTDIHHLITTLDDIIDEIEDIAKLIVLYKFDHLREEAIQLADILVTSTQEVLFTVNENHGGHSSPLYPDQHAGK